MAPSALPEISEVRIDHKGPYGPSRYPHIAHGRNFRYTQGKLHGKYKGNIKGISEEYVSEYKGIYKEYPLIFIM